MVLFFSHKPLDSIWGCIDTIRTILLSCCWSKKVSFVEEKLKIFIFCFLTVSFCLLLFSQVISRAIKEGIFEKLLEIDSRLGMQNGNDDEEEEEETKENQITLKVIHVYQFFLSLPSSAEGTTDISASPYFNLFYIVWLKLFFLFSLADKFTINSRQTFHFGQ